MSTSSCGLATCLSPSQCPYMASSLLAMMKETIIGPVGRNTGTSLANDHSGHTLCDLRAAPASH